MIFENFLFIARENIWQQTKTSDPFTAELPTDTSLPDARQVWRYYILLVLGCVCVHVFKFLPQFSRKKYKNNWFGHSQCDHYLSVCVLLSLFQFSLHKTIKT